MASYHINPETGNPGICRTTPDRCPYGKEGALHYDSKEEARAAYEETQEARAASELVELDGDGYLAESELAKLKVYGMSCPKCGVELDARSHNAGEDNEAVCSNGHSTFIDELTVQMTPDNPSYKFLDKQAVKDEVWYHSSLSPNWLDSVDEDDEESTVHVGVEDSSYDRALWDYAGKRYREPQAFYLYEVRIVPEAAISDKISQSNYTVDRETERDLDEGIAPEDVTRYHNTVEGPGSISLIAKPKMLEIIGVRRIEPDVAQRRLSIMNINPKSRNRDDES